MKYLQISRLSSLGFRVGANMKLETEFFPLKGADDDEDSQYKTSMNTNSDEDVSQSQSPNDPVLCMRYGNGVVIFDDVVGHFNLKEARGDVRNKMIEE